MGRVVYNGTVYNRVNPLKGFVTILSFFCLMMLISPAYADTQTIKTDYTMLFNFKKGVLTLDETWTGKNLLLSDVVVPEGITLTLSNDTWLIFNEVDLANLGNNESQPELIVYGKLLKPEGLESVKMVSFGAPIVQDYIEYHIEKNRVSIAPEDEPLTDLTENLHQSRRYYAWIWAALYSIWLIL